MSALDMLLSKLDRQRALRNIPAIAAAAGVPRRSVQSILDGKVPSVTRAEELCAALGLEFYIGPPREGATPLPVAIPDNNETSTLEITELRSQLASLQTDLVDKLSETAAAVESLTVTPANDDERDNAHPVPVVEVASAAGAGSVIDMEAVTGHVWFRRRWLSDYAIDPKQCAIIGVKGDSMEPTLMDGCSILVDYNRTRRHAGHIYVIRTDDGLVAKRLDHGDTGDWVLKSDNREWEPIAWSDDMEIVGEVRWMARTLAGK